MRPLKIQNGRQGAPKWPTGSGKLSTPRVFGHSHQLSLNKFFDLSTPSMRNIEHLQNPKWPPGGPKMADGVWKGVLPKVNGRSEQLSQNRFFGAPVID